MAFGFQEAQGAPSINTSRRDTGWVSAPQQDYQSQIMRLKNPIVQAPSWQPAFQFSVPPFAYKIRGNWTAPDVPVFVGGGGPSAYPFPTEAPEIQYRNKSWDALISRAANPIPVPTQPAYQLSAPSVTVNISS